ncbi:glutathione S-transferase N-terminal domain-containing protein [Glaciecola sp. 2405UD65-10]|uniref:glutathione S-transferase N-terminal domain-containing protein n=1 Tax=Glaciecola sp. 2405UD65-10 TaxID=3397244 RepID=UPI003B59B24E
MKLIINLIRNILGGLIAFVDLITRGRKLKRSAQDQANVAEQAQNLSLYQFFACPFCIKTRRAIYKLNVPIEKHSVSNDSQYRTELLEQGGKIQTPCLRIQSPQGVTWLYESSEIIAYLQKRFA